MKTFLCLSLLFLMWQVRAEEPDYIYKAAAQVKLISFFTFFFEKLSFALS